MRVMHVGVDVLLLLFVGSPLSPDIDQRRCPRSRRPTAKCRRRFGSSTEPPIHRGRFRAHRAGGSDFVGAASARNRRWFCRRKFWRAQALAKLLRQPEDGKLLSEVSQILRRYVIAAFELPPRRIDHGGILRRARRQRKNRRGTGRSHFRVFCASVTSGNFRRRQSVAPLNAAGRALRTWSRSRETAGATRSTGAQLPPCRYQMNGEFEFQYPWLLALLGLLPVYALLRGKAGKLSALTFSSADIARAAGAQARAAAGRFLFFLRLLAVALGIVALAGPRLANYHVETETPGIDIMLVLDLSWSMMAIDMGRPAEKLSRFAIASGVLKDFIQKRPNDRIGLIAFSGVPYLASPLTLNHDWLIENLQRLHIGIITRSRHGHRRRDRGRGQTAQGGAEQQEPHHDFADRRRQQHGQD